MKAIAAKPYSMWLWAAVLLVGLALIWWLALSSVRMPATILPNEAIDVDGVEREYRLVIPDSLDATKPVPLLLAFHGALDTTQQAADYMQLDRLAASKGFLLAYPQGRFLNWPPSITEDNLEYVEAELAFIDALIDELALLHNVDTKRVYVAGMSQGAAFVNMLIARRSQKLAAAVSHSGWLPDPLHEEGIRTKHKCPVLFIAGSKDAQVPPSTVMKACTQFQQEGHPVRFHLIKGLGHTWAWRSGVNEEIWEFVSPHRLP
jgi:poly(3-hydroxybutyrate) depolymerase